VRKKNKTYAKAYQGASFGTTRDSPDPISGDARQVTDEKRRKGARAGKALNRLQGAPLAAPSAPLIPVSKQAKKKPARRS